VKAQKARASTARSFLFWRITWKQGRCVSCVRAWTSRFSIWLEKAINFFFLLFTDYSYMLYISRALQPFNLLINQ
jgi:hypothetical protein